MGTGTMTRGEKAVLYVTNQYITQSPLMPIIEGVEEVLFEVELVHFIQVCRLLPAVNYSCLFICFIKLLSLFVRGHCTRCKSCYECFVFFMSR